MKESKVDWEIRKSGIFVEKILNLSNFSQTWLQIVITWGALKKHFIVGLTSRDSD